MRTGRIARTIGQAAVVGLLGLGVSVAGGQAAWADDFSWDTPAPVIPDDFSWDTAPGGDALLSDFSWD